MEFDFLGWPEDGPTLRLDYRRFSYAGKFVMSNTGKAVVRERDGAESASDVDDARSSEFDDDVLAAVAFNDDRTDSTTLWLRYVTVRDDYRANGLGAKLVAFVAETAEAKGYDRLCIAVNNPFAFEALYKAGFGYTCRQTGLAELVLERPADRDEAAYQRGLDVFRERDPDDPEATFLRDRVGADPPSRLESSPVTFVDGGHAGRVDSDDSGS
ncbi:MAG: GNAT family N-acetyltransferase [Halobacteriota archaeon]